MIRIIFGIKGSGKTKRIIDAANECMRTTKGDVLFITDTDRYNLEIDHNIRLVNTKKLDISGAEQFKGLVKGLFAGNGDITDLYIDGLSRIVNLDLNDMEGIYSFIEGISEGYGVKITITISSDNLPEFVAKFTKR